MNTVSKLPYVLVAMAVVFSGIGFAINGYGIARTASLLVVLSIFSVLMAHTLESASNEWEINRPKATTLIILGFFFFAVEVYLVHYGLMWAFPDWSEEVAYIGGIGFAAVNVFAKWAYTPSEIPEEATSLGENVTSINERMTG